MAGRDGNLARYQAAQMSDGTLRALACLVALYGPVSPEHGWEARLVALEEPETAVHPGAVRVLLDAMREASRTRQVIVTTHSPDLLDHPDIGADEIRSVTMENGETIIAEVDDVARQALRDKLYTAGELHRLGQLTPAGAGNR
jgi:predicted ATPase